MDHLPFPNTPEKPGQEPRLRQIGKRPESLRRHNEGYSVFIRRMRVVLPLAALCIIAVVFSWNTLQQDKIVPAEPDTQTVSRIGKNELINPRFDSIDDKNQPYTITAVRALQGNTDEDDLLLLNEPTADLALNSGNWVALKSDQGAFRQGSRRLLLKDNVALFHDDGYTMETQELDVDLNAGTARTEFTVTAYGPLGTLDANGMMANSNEETLVFKGPAKLVLFDTGGGFNMETLNPW